MLTGFLSNGFAWFIIILRLDVLYGDGNMVFRFRRNCGRLKSCKWVVSIELFTDTGG